MGWLGTLGKIVGNVVPALFTGGASLPGTLAATGITTAGEIASAAMGAGAESMARGRGARAQAELDLQKQMEEQLLARQEEKRAAQQQAARLARIGSMFAGYRPLTRPEGIPGTYQSAAAAPEGRLMAEELYRQGMRRMLQPDLVQAEGMPAYESPAERVRAAAAPGMLERILGIGSWALPITGGVLDTMGQRGKTDALTPRPFYDLNPKR